jgi:hypothetical protein
MVIHGVWEKIEKGGAINFGFFKPLLRLDGMLVWAQRPLAGISGHYHSRLNS